MNGFGFVRSRTLRSSAGTGTATFAVLSYADLTNTLATSSERRPRPIGLEHDLVAPP